MRVPYPLSPVRLSLCLLLLLTACNAGDAKRITPLAEPTPQPEITVTAPTLAPTATGTPIPTVSSTPTAIPPSATHSPTPLPLNTYCLWPGDTLYNLALYTQVTTATLLAANPSFTGEAGSAVRLPRGSLPPDQWTQPAPVVRTVFDLPFGASGIFLGSNNRLKRVALTFDIGYEPENSALFAALDEQGIHATFFVLGSSVDKHPEMIADLLAHGHELGNHSWDHLNMLSMTSDEISLELDRTEHAVRLAQPGATTRPFFRAPFGAINDTVKDVAQNAGYYVIGWTIDSGDWQETATPEQVYKHVTQAVCPGAIIAMHDVNPANGDALPRIIEFLIASGYEIVPLSKMVQVPVP